MKEHLKSLGDLLTGKQVKELSIITELPKSTIYNYLNGEGKKIDIAEKIINSANKILQHDK